MDGKNQHFQLIIGRISKCMILMVLAFSILLHETISFSFSMQNIKLIFSYLQSFSFFLDWSATLQTSKAALLTRAFLSTLWLNIALNIYWINIWVVYFSLLVSLMQQLSDHVRLF